MIRLTEIITHLRNNLPSWSVEGAVDQSVAEDNSRLKLPAMYVGLIGVDYTIESESTYLQSYVDKFFILTCTPTTEAHDRTGKYAQDVVYIARDAFKLLLVNNPQFDLDSYSIVFKRDMPDKFDKARYFHRFEFEVHGWLDKDDVTPLALDLFDTFFATYKTTDFTDNTPVVESLDSNLYFTPPED